MQNKAPFAPVFNPTEQRVDIQFDTWLDPNFDPAAVMAALYKQINGGYPYVEQTGFYLDPLGSLGWTRVSRQKEYSEGMRSIAYSSVSEMVGHMLAQEQGVREIDLIILAPGEADAEAILAQHMAPFFEKVRVFLIEASGTLLRHAKQTVENALGHMSHASVYGIEGDILGLWQYLDSISPPAPSRKRVVIALTILYNLQEELHFIHNNFIRLSKGDLFIFDFWKTLGPLDRPEQIWKLEPRLAGTHVHAGWDQALDHWHYNLLRRYCDGFESVRFSYTLSTHGCPIPDSYAVDKLAHIQRQDGSDYTLVLQRFKRYHPEQLVRTLQREGWLPVHLWPSRKSKNAALYLFERMASPYEQTITLGGTL